MSKIEYVPHHFGTSNLKIVTQANGIIEEYADQGFNLTLRQLYYQLVSRGMLPNKQTEYKRLGSVINDARLAGLVDWSAIVDRTRHVRGNSHWSGPREIIRSCAMQFQIDKWADQPNHVEVFVEKDALIGVIGSTCTKLDVSFFSCRGYVSQTEAWQAAMRYQRLVRGGKKVTVLHLSDHDPSGIDMTRDLAARFSTFGVDVEVRRIALTMKQVRKYNPPPNPAKESDSRFDDYRREHGDKSWELDALEPKAMAALISKHVKGLRDEKRWDAQVEIESRMRLELMDASERMGDRT